VKGLFREGGLSDALGAIILVAVVGGAVALAGVYILSQPTPEKIPALSSDITTVGRMILITHNGGDALIKSEMAIIVDGTDLTSLFQRLDGAPWSSWSVGDTLEYRVPGGQPMPQGVSLFYTGGSSARLINSMGVPQSVSAGGLYPTGATTQPTAVVTAPPGPFSLPVIADFSANPTTGQVPLSTQFTDASTGPVANRSWEFGDGGTSFLQNPVHQYSAAGTYPVHLIVSNGSGSSTLTKPNYITVTQYATGLLANYYNDKSWSVPAVTKKATRIHFADAASGAASDIPNWPIDYIGKADSFSVSFDGLLYVPANDTYTFYLTSDDGSYLSLDGSQVIDNGGDHSPQERTATLTLTSGYHPIQVRMYENGGGAVVYLDYSTPASARTLVTNLYHTPNTPPVSDFTGVPRVGTSPLTVLFTDTSIDASSWAWDFGDGSPVSYQQNPQHTYLTGNNFTVSLTTTNGIGSNTAVKNNFIVIGTLTPGFSASYYRNQTWTSPFSGRIDSRIAFADPAGVSTGYPSDEPGWPNSIIGTQDDFSVSWDGYLNVPSAGTYTFYLTSDDGAWLWIDESEIVNNGGLHAPQMASGSVTLTPGYHAIRVRMFENTGNAVAYLEYSTPAIARTFVTDVGHG
jgi:PKD repeat protein